MHSSAVGPPTARLAKTGMCGIPNYCPQQIRQQKYQQLYALEFKLLQG
jgi:hypothetical protein